MFFQAPSYIGCYVFINDRELLVKQVQWSNMTINICRTHCMGYQYAALHGSITCYCSDRIFTSKSKDGDRDCTDKCLGNELEACGRLGGENYLSIYDGNYNFIGDFICSCTVFFCTHVVKVEVVVNS